MRLTSKGQVTIPQHVREALGLLAGTEVEFEIDGDAVRIRKAKGRGQLSRGQAIVEHGRGRGNMRYTTDELMRLMRG
jgi:AbrB family looped-hinge helix DNA binding protein